MELKPSTPTTDKNHTEKVFTIFPKLPRELRDEIWNKSIIPRLVHFQPGGGMAPAVLFINEESHKATRGHYLVCYVPLQRHGRYALFINFFRMDNVYGKQGGLTASVVIEADLFWNVQPWICCLKVLNLQDTEQQRHMKVVRDGLESHRTVGNLVNLKLTFLDLVPFTPMWDMDMKSSFVAWAG
ncbi:hypothetical protein DL95DRAFT_460529 [Leptodontidium sp. 2 PMI_412]|nr:hypothetical protein DL95DRAFT_460529 [Leptodontidium sp. 2 PMI_412]